MALNLKKPLVYVTRDIERALGINPGRYGESDYLIVSNETAYGREIQTKYPKNVFLMENQKTLDTYDLLSLPEVGKIISKRDADVVVFQNTSRIERLAKEKGWNLLNPSASLAKTVEEKISQVNWLDDDAKFLPPCLLTTVGEVAFAGKKFVLQFNHSHTGQGTYIINSEKTLTEIREKFPNRECRVVDFIDGPVFTVNAVVIGGAGGSGASVIIGNPSYQITGISPFTDLPFSTVGNDWSLPQRKEFGSLRVDTVFIAQAIGARLKKSGWKGMFGIDLVYDPKDKKTYLLEINARQPASAVFESSLEKSAAPENPSIFEEHIAALLEEKIPSYPIAKIYGSQIVKRATKKLYDIDIARLRAEGFSVMEYENEDHNKELFRIQSEKGIMEAHGELNVFGKFIQTCIKPKMK